MAGDRFLRDSGKSTDDGTAGTALQNYGLSPETQQERSQVALLFNRMIRMSIESAGTQTPSALACSVVG